MVETSFEVMFFQRFMKEFKYPCFSVKIQTRIIYPIQKISIYGRYCFSFLSIRYSTEMTTFNSHLNLQKNPIVQECTKEFPSASPTMILRVTISLVPTSDCFLPKRNQRQKRQEKLKEAIEELATIQDVEGKLISLAI